MGPTSGDAGNRIADPEALPAGAIASERERHDQIAGASPSPLKGLLSSLGFDILSVPFPHRTFAHGAAMKINIQIDCTPQEMRTFFGLPDLEPLQREWLTQVQERMKKGMEALDPATLMLLNPAFGEQMKLFEAMQKNFWQAFSTPTKSESKD